MYIRWTHFDLHGCLMGSKCVIASSNVWFTSDTEEANGQPCLIVRRALQFAHIWQPSAEHTQRSLKMHPRCACGMHSNDCTRMHTHALGTTCCVTCRHNSMQSTRALHLQIWFLHWFLRTAWRHYRAAFHCPSMHISFGLFASLPFIQDSITFSSVGAGGRRNFPLPPKSEKSL